MIIYSMDAQLHIYHYHVFPVHTNDKLCPVVCMYIVYIVYIRTEL